MLKKITCLLFVSLIVAVASFSQQIIIDTSFGTNGIVSIRNINEDLYLKRITAQHNGKIIAPFTSDESGYADNGVLVRYTTDGEIDRTFGTKGYREVMHGYNNSSLCAVLVQPDDKLLVYSNFYNRGNYTDSLFIERWLPNGDYDSSFGVNGIESVGGYGYENPNQTFMALKPDGHIVVTYNGNLDTFFMAELKPNGNIERNFGDHGFIKLYSFNNNNNTPVGLTALPDNRIVIANQYPVGMQGFNYYYKDNLATYTANGKPDLSVGTNGVVYISDTTYHNYTADMKTWQNKLYVYAEGSNQEVLIRYNANGTLDNTFGTNGKVYSGEQPSSFYTDVRAFDIQQDGKIITALSGNNTYKRYFTNGAQDLSFGVDGVFTPKKKSQGTDFEIIKNHLYIASVSYSSDEGYAGLNLSGFKLVSSSSATAVAISQLAIHPAIAVYPNPATNTVNISGLSDGVHHVRVITQNGKIMSDVTAAGINYQLNMIALANGIYFIQVTDELKTTTFKIIKQ